MIEFAAIIGGRSLTSGYEKAAHPKPPPPPPPPPIAKVLLTDLGPIIVSPTIINWSKLCSAGLYSIFSGVRTAAADGAQASMLLNAANYATGEHLRDGGCIEIRALKPDDKTNLLAAVSRMSGQSIRRRFFGAKRDFSEKEQAFYLNVDFVSHVALVAVVEAGNRMTIVGGARYVVVRPGTAEVAFAVVDEFQAQGIGPILLRHLAVVARAAGVSELVAEVLPENAAMLKVFGKCGLNVTMKRDVGTVHVKLQIS